MHIPRPSYLLRLGKSRRQVSPTVHREIAQVMDAYDLGCWQLKRVLLGGRNSYNYLLQTDHGEKVLKKHRWSLLKTSPEHAILRYLNDTDFPIARVMLNRDGDTWTDWGGAHYAVYDFIRGFRCDEFYLSGATRRRLIAQAGETLGRFHQLLDGFTFETQQVEGYTSNGKRLVRDTAWHLETLEQYVASINRTSPNSLDMLVLRNLDKLRHDLVETGLLHEQSHLNQPKQMIHRDYVAKNIMFDAKALVAVLDFASAGLDLRALDIARALESFARRGKYGLDAFKVGIFLDAYRSHLPLSDDEVTLIPMLLRWRTLRFLIWRLGEDLPLSRKQASFRDRWARACWLERNSEELLEALLAPRARAIL